MSLLTCPYCRGAVPSTGELTCCPGCGRNIAWLDSTRDFVIHGVDLWRVLRGQRHVNLALTLIGATIGGIWLVLRVPVDSSPVLGVAVVVLLLLHVLLANGFYEMLSGYARFGGLGFWLVLLLILPGVNVVAAVCLNFAAARTARRVRLPWRFFGWSEDALRGAFARTFCRQCGYNLTGNVSGRCPECGTAVPEEETEKAREDQQMSALRAELNALKEQGQKESK